MAGEIAPAEGCSIYDLLDVLILNMEDGGGSPLPERVMEWWRSAKRRWIS